MKKLFLSLVLAAISACALNAQSSAKYHCELDLGYSFGVGTFSTDRVNIQTIQGIKVGDYFSTGVGFGLDYYHEFYDAGELMMPIFLNVKGYLPTSEKASVYASFDIGAGIGLTEGVSELSGMTYTPAIGVKVNKFKAQLGYNVQRISENGVGIDMNAIQIKIGLMF